jgi:predicted AAA+ superfamily ATPase
MERFLYKDLLKWKVQDNRKPLLLQGARQVGKTYLLKEFARREYKDFAYFNFEQTPELATLFNYSLKPMLLVESLSAFISKKIEADETLIFFDEIQECPRALTSLKYFYEQAPEFHVVSAGSLLGVSVGKTSSFPVGKVNFMTLYPMSYFEYLAAAGEKSLLKLLKDKMDYSPIAEAFHERLIRYLKYYLYIGGMPEAVQDYLTNRDLSNVRMIQREILNAYERDFSKHTSKSEAIRISEVWQSIPGQLAKENRKFLYSEVKKGGRASRFESAVEWLHKSGILLLSYCLKVPKLPLSGYEDESKFKLYVLDSGLLGAMLDVSSQMIVLGEKLFSEYYGAFIENHVACELTCSAITDRLYYWTSKSDAEVDFIVSRPEGIFPLEVKSGLSRHIKSLRSYAKKYQPPFIYRTSARNFTRDNDFINLPLYAVSLLGQL